MRVAHSAHFHVELCREGVYFTELNFHDLIYDGVSRNVVRRKIAVLLIKAFFRNDFFCDSDNAACVAACTVHNNVPALFNSSGVKTLKTNERREKTQSTGMKYAVCFAS
jgi:hypothetical protein